MFLCLSWRSAAERSLHRAINALISLCVLLQVHNLGNQVRVTWTQAKPSTATTTLGAFYAQPNATGLINITGTNTPAGMAEAVLTIVPTQFHFHTTSEHTIEGRFAALETHLVANVTGANTSCANTCTAVFAVLYDFSADDATGAADGLILLAFLVSIALFCSALHTPLVSIATPFGTERINQLSAYMQRTRRNVCPSAADVCAACPAGNDFLAPFLANIPPNVTSNNVTYLGSNYTLNLTDLLPVDTSQYVHYSGSLTTPPCTEGVSWTIFTETQPISVLQVQTLSDLLATAIMDGFTPERTDNRLPQPLYNRTMWSYGPTSATF